MATGAPLSLARGTYRDEGRGSSLQGFSKRDRGENDSGPALFVVVWVGGESAGVQG